MAALEIPRPETDSLPRKTIDTALAYLREAPHARVQLTHIADVPNVLYVVTAVHDAKLGFFNPGVNLGTSLGGTRVMQVSGEDEGIRQAKLLAHDMTYKWAALNRMLTQQFWEGKANDYEVYATMMGGNKSVIGVKSIDQYLSLNQKDHARVFEHHADHVTAMDGPITAVDMFTSSADMDIIARRVGNRYVACQSESLGGTGNPSGVTAAGVWYGAKALMESRSIDPKHAAYAVQGVGAVGSELVKIILEHSDDDAIIYISDVDSTKTEIVKSFNPQRIVPVALDEIHKKPADIFIPCAGPEILTSKLLEEINRRTGIVCGSTNDPWPVDAKGEPDPELIREFEKNNIAVAPAWVVNLGGILSVSTGFWKNWGGPESSNTRALQLVSGVEPFTKALYEKAHAEHRPMEHVAYDVVASTLIRFCQANNLQL